MRILIGATLAVAISACAGSPYPEKRPLTQDRIAEMGETDVVVSQNNGGVGASWYMTDSSAAGASYGLVGALVTSVMDAIINAGPARVALNSADELDEVVSTAYLNQSLADALTTAKVSAGSDGVSIGDVSVRQLAYSKDTLDDAVKIDVDYILSEDARAMRVTAIATYSRNDVAYATPYSFEGSVPKPELTGPLYRNTFTYESDQLPAPVFDEEVKAQLVATVKQWFSDETGTLPAEDSEDYKKYAKALENASDDKLTKSETAMLLVGEWTRDNGALAKREVDKAHAFFAEYIVTDLNSIAVPSIDGTDTPVEQLADARAIRMIGSGVKTGSITSSPGNLTEFTTYGNAVQYPSDNVDAMRDLRKASTN